MKTASQNRSRGTAIVVTSLLMLFAAGCAGTTAQRSAGNVIDDGVLISRVKTALIRNDETKARQIDVEVYRGEVQLNGFVDSATEKAAAATTARSVQGVQAVRNNLQIRADRSAGEVVDDAVIVARVKTALVGDERTRAYQVEVKANDGVVQLGGFVDSQASKSAAAEIARSVNGVRRVSNNLEIRD
jgi:hyperosmotically inducible periplasmic protein